MIVWLLTMSWYDGRDWDTNIIGVYDSKEKAEKAKDWYKKLDIQDEIEKDGIYHSYKIYSTKVQ